MFIEAEGDQIILEREDSVESPRGVGDDLRELFFEEAGGFEVVEGLSREALAGIEVLGGQDSGRLNGTRSRDCAR